MLTHFEWTAVVIFGNLSLVYGVFFSYLYITQAVKDRNFKYVTMNNDFLRNSAHFMNGFVEELLNSKKLARNKSN